MCGRKITPSPFDSQRPQIIPRAPLFPRCNILAVEFTAKFLRKFEAQKTATFLYAFHFHYHHTITKLYRI